MKIVQGTTKYEFVPLNDAMSVIANSTSDCNQSRMAAGRIVSLADYLKAATVIKYAP